MEKTIKNILLSNSYIFFWLSVGILLRDLTTFIPLISFTLIVIRYFSNSSKKFDGVFLILFIAVSFYALMGFLGGFVTLHNVLWIFFMSIISYMVGKRLSFRFKDPTDLFFLLFFLAFLLALHNIPITLADVFKYGLVNPERDLGILGEGQRHTTGRTVELCLAIAGIYMIFVSRFNNVQAVVRKYFIYISLLALICALHYVSRTGVSIFVIALLLGWLLEKGSIKRMIIVAIITGIVFYFFLMDSPLFQVYLNREIEGSTISDAGGRTERWQLGLTMLLNSPKGYAYETNYWYAHNFWLDFGREGGIIAFIALALFSLCVLCKTFVIARKNIFPSWINKTLILYTLVFIVTLFTETVHTGAPILMYVYFIFSGLVCGFANKS